MTFLTPAPIAAIAIVAGVVLLVAGVSSGLGQARRARRDPARALALMRGFRVALVGGCAVGLGSAWLWQSPVFVPLWLVILAEELLESSVVIAALRRAASGRG
jgi:hypothetical protein